MPTISITRKIEFNKAESRKIAEAYQNSKKIIVQNNPQKLDSATFIKNLEKK